MRFSKHDYEFARGRRFDLDQLLCAQNVVEMHGLSFAVRFPVCLIDDRAGRSMISISQLRVIARWLGIASGDLLRESDGLTERLRMQVVVVSDEKDI